VGTSLHGQASDIEFAEHNSPNYESYI
jgi:hypothetical protein